MYTITDVVCCTYFHSVRRKVLCRLGKKKFKIRKSFLSRLPTVIPTLRPLVIVRKKTPENKSGSHLFPESVFSTIIVFQTICCMSGIIWEIGTTKRKRDNTRASLWTARLWSSYAFF